MITRRKILGITSIRSDYDLMFDLYQGVSSSPHFIFKLLVSGAHLSKSYGYTIDNIENDGFDILAEIETLIDSDSNKSRVKTASILLQNSIEIVDNWKPDLIIYAGDREDVLIFALLGSYMKIPTAHFYGGDHASDGHVDNPVRHACSKLSTYHFVSTQRHKNRLQSIGESNKRIFMVGAIQLDRIKRHKKLSLSNLREKINLPKKYSAYCILIFHPLDKDQLQYAKHFENIIKALLSFQFYIYCGSANTDPGNKDSMGVVNKYVDNQQVHFYGNYPREQFLDLFVNSKFLIGNSSSGIIESASVPMPVINVGERQYGRDTSGNVIFCNSSINNIKQAIEVVTNQDFISKVQATQNVYGDGKSAERSLRILEQLQFNKMIYKSEDPLEYIDE